MNTNDNYKMVFLDVDGTLLTPEQTISARTLKILNELKKHNVECVIASGRQREITTKLSQKINGSRYVISATGGDVYDYENDIEIFKDVLDNEIVKKIYELVKINNARIRMLTGTHAYSNKPSKNMIDIEKQIDEDIDEFLKKESVSQCVIMTDNLDTIKRIKAEIGKIKSLRICNQSKILADENFTAKQFPEYFIDVCNLNVSKGNGIKELCNYLNLDKSYTISIGDDFNDLPMFENSGLSIAMGNSPEKVKEQAKVVTLSNAEDGVAYILEKIFKDII